MYVVGLLYLPFDGWLPKTLQNSPDGRWKEGKGTQGASVGKMTRIFEKKTVIKMDETWTEFDTRRREKSKMR